jgi:hypothetical protein
MPVPQIYRGSRIWIFSQLPVVVILLGSPLLIATGFAKFFKLRLSDRNLKTKAMLESGQHFPLLFRIEQSHPMADYVRSLVDQRNGGRPRDAEFFKVCLHDGPTRRL